MIERAVVHLVETGRLSVDTGAAILVELSLVDGLEVAISLLSIALGTYLGAVT